MPALSPEGVSDALKALESTLGELDVSPELIDKLRQSADELADVSMGGTNGQRVEQAYRKLSRQLEQIELGLAGTDSTNGSAASRTERADVNDSAADYYRRLGQGSGGDN